VIDPGGRTGRWLLALLGFVSAAYFLQRHPGWNVNSRLALVYAVVDEHRLAIDTFHESPGYETLDKAVFEDHFYSDKVIGNALAAIPIYQVARWVSGALGLPLSSHAKRYLCRTFTVSVAFGLTLMVLAGLFERQGVSPRHASALAALGGLGTMLFPYATIFYPYSPAVLFSLLAYRLTLPKNSEDPVHALPVGRVFLAGLAMGASLLFELLFGLIGLVLVAHLVGSQRPLKRGLIAAGLFGLGAALALVPLFMYLWAVFGRFAIPYEYEYRDVFRESMASGFQGIHFPPKPAILWLITFHPFRGLFFHSPLLLFALPGLVAMTRLPNGPWRMLMCLAIFVGYVTVNGGYYHHWWGGLACGPRHLIPAIPFLLLPVAAAWARWRALRPLILLAGLVSVGLQLLPAGIDPQPPVVVPAGHTAEEYLAAGTLDRPYYDPVTWHHLPSLREGVVAWNPGLWLGLPGGLSWTPLLVIWAVAGLWLVGVPRARAER
jgi:hypothetical protein